MAEGCVIGERAAIMPEFIRTLMNEASRLWDDSEFVLAAGKGRKCIEAYGVETRNDAMEFWIEPYIGELVLECILRDIWLIVCDYALASQPIPSMFGQKVARWYFYLGYCYSELGSTRWIDAIRMYSRSLHFHPTYSNSFANRSYCHLQLEHYAEALVDANDSLKQKPGNAWGLEFKGRALVGLGEFESGLELMSKALALFPTADRIENCQRKITDCKNRQLVAIAKRNLAIDMKTAELRLESISTLTPMTNMAEWSMTNVGQWLKSLSPDYVPYIASFENHAINGPTLLQFNDTRLKKLGVNNEIHRLRMLVDICSHQTKNRPIGRLAFERRGKRKQTEMLVIGRPRTRSIAPTQTKRPKKS